VRIALVGTGLLLLVISCGGTGDSVPDRPSATVTFEGTAAELRVSVAETPESRRRGLMGVDRLAEDSGMAFVFDEPVHTTFWMKDTLIPLSIAFVDAQGRIVTLRDMEPCEAGPCPRYGATGPFVMAIEANRGWFAAHGVEVGDGAELREGAYG